MTESVHDLLGPQGAVARRLPDYEERPEQLALAVMVEEALRDRCHLLAEAGTGVGKSFAYLLPAVLHACAHRGSGPVIVSTRTIALQQQLEQKDLPFLHGVLPLEWTSATAVGRNNYLCLRRLHLAHSERGLLFPDADRQAQLEEVVAWSLSTREGTRMDLPRPVDPRVWEEVQAEHGNCLHRACKFYEPCHYQRARRRMDGAQVLIVNHALYMADVALRSVGVSYLPAHEVVIFDEAHHLERVATEHLGLRLDATTVSWNLRRLHPRNAAKSLLLQYCSQRAGMLWHAVQERNDAFFGDLAARLGARETLALEEQTLDAELAERLGELGREVEANAAGVEELDRHTELLARARSLLGLEAVVRGLCTAAGAASVRWIEQRKRGPSLRSAPLEVSSVLREMVFGKCRTAVLTSATLAAGRDAEFTWLRQRLGIDEARTALLGSPFDYRRAVRLVLEEALPDPGRDATGFVREAKVRVLDHVLANGGRALVLCTSWSQVAEVADFLRPRLAAADIRLLVQGDDVLARLLEQKKNEPTSVLVGTDSLWEGIDVRGGALTMVVMLRFPFTPPDHPLTRARMRAVERAGGNAFADYSLPEAVLKFRQGFGRLVRAQSDRGTVVVLDPRTRTRPYGRVFLDALPQGIGDLNATPSEP
jgi:ATP-dependent DNA helicase DinG